MTGTGGRHRRGPVWHARRWWASHGRRSRILAVIIGIPLALFTLLMVLGGILQACGVDGMDPESPRSTDSPTASVSAPASEVPEPVVTVTSTEKATPEPAVTVTRTSTEKATPKPAVTVTKTASRAPAVKPQPPLPEQPEPEPPPAAYYENCDDARAAGVAPLHRGDPGYSSDLDRDGDGVACEPYYGR